MVSCQLIQPNQRNNLQKLSPQLFENLRRQILDPNFLSQGAEFGHCQPYPNGPIFKPPSAIKIPTIPTKVRTP